MSDVTQLLERAESGDPTAAEELLPLVYGELRRLAAAKMARETPGQTLQPTALVHEAWLRLHGSSECAWNSRNHFFAAAAEAMRRILVDRARQRTALKRGADAEHVDVSTLEIPIAVRDEDELLAVNEVLDRFAALKPRQAELVKLRYFTGFTFEEAAAVLGISIPTAKEWWAHARAWLAVEIRREQKL